MLLEQINAAEKRMNEIKKEVQGVEAKDPEGLKKIEALTEEYRSLDKQRAQLRAAYDLKEVDVTVSPVISLNEASGGQRSSDPYATLEYRTAFKTFFQTGVRTPELRADESTVQSEISALIPTPIQNKVIEELIEYGRLYAKIAKTNFAAGTRISINSVQPVASWVGENEKSDRKKLTANTYVSFNSYKLQVRIATSLEASVNSLDIFETLISKSLVRAIVIAIETAMISGSGVAQPTGITVDARIKAAQKVATTLAQLNYAGWTERFGKMPSGYLNGNLTWMMAQETYFKYVVGLVDANGQPVARTIQGLDGKPKYTLFGHVVEFTSALPTADAAANDAIFVILGDLEQYDFNSNLNMSYRKYVDEETDESVDKVTLLGDGKVLDASAFVLFKKAGA